MSLAKKHGSLATNCLEIKPFRRTSKHNWFCFGFGGKKVCIVENNFVIKSCIMNLI